MKILIKYLFLFIPLILNAEGVKVILQEDGLYKVSYKDLHTYFKDNLTPTITIQGKEVAYTILGDNDRELENGEDLVFVGKMLRGKHSYYNEYSYYNAAFIKNSKKPTNFKSISLTPSNNKSVWILRLHYENDKIFLRYPYKTERDQEMWFWEKLTPLDKSFSIKLPVELGKFTVADDLKMVLKLSFIGWSTSPGVKPGEPQHIVNVFFNGRSLGQVKWNGNRETIEQTFELHLKDIKDSNNLQLEVPKRYTDKGTLIPDVVIFNWAELIIPITSVKSGKIVLEATEDDPSLSIEANGEYLISHEDKGISNLINCPCTLSIKANKGDRIFVFRKDKLLSPIEIRTLKGNKALDTTPADYLMITHPKIARGLDKLAAFHESKGLKVKVIDVEAIYDAFSYGTTDPEAIAKFVRFAYKKWKKKPRFLLLAGDASWDPKNEHPDITNYPASTYRPDHFVYFDITPAQPYSESMNRNLVPTWNYATYDGHAAGDNYFADVNNDGKPELAVGRFPAANLKELASMVEKTIKWVEHLSDSYLWKRKVLWIASEDRWMQNSTLHVYKNATRYGFFGPLLFPSSQNKTMPEDKQRIFENWNKGAFSVFFFGHGGRFIWRTGPPDWKKHVDLFTVKDVEKLVATTKLPIVVAMTCFSAPFDHPSADSIGEKLLREKMKGAIGVIAASWRIAPSTHVSSKIYENLAFSQTLGEAVKNVKRTINDKQFIEIFNLLGDPALPIPKIQRNVSVELNGKKVKIFYPSDTRSVNVIWIKNNSYKKEQLLPKTPYLELHIPELAEKIIVYGIRKNGYELFGYRELKSGG